MSTAWPQASSVYKCSPIYTELPQQDVLHVLGFHFPLNLICNYWQFAIEYYCAAVLMVSVLREKVTLIVTVYSTDLYRYRVLIMNITIVVDSKVYS